MTDKQGGHSEQAVQNAGKSARDLTGWAVNRDAQLTVEWMSEARAALAAGDVTTAADCLNAAQETAWLARGVHDFRAELAALNAEWRAAK